MGVLATLAGLMAWGVLLDHYRYGGLAKRECLRARGRMTHEAVALGLTGTALGMTLPRMLKRKGR